MNLLLTYIATLVPMIVLDAIWILVVAKNFYAEQMGFLFTKSVKILPIAFFYPLYAFVILMLVVLPGISSGSWVGVLWRGALLGLAAYAAYDLTNHATIDRWPISMTVVDILWGVVVTALTSAIAYFFITSFK